MYVPKEPKYKRNDPIIMDNLVILDPKTNWPVKDPMVFLYSRAGNDDNVQGSVEPVNIQITLNKFSSLEVVVEEKFEESSQDKDFVDATQLMEDDNDSIENSL